jgi:uncharacterized membrane protein
VEVQTLTVNDSPWQDKDKDKKSSTRSSSDSRERGSSTSSSSGAALGDLNVLKKDSMRDDLRKGLTADDDSSAAPVQGLRDLKNRRGVGTSAAMSEDSESSATLSKMKGDGQADILKEAEVLKKQLQEEREARLKEEQEMHKAELEKRLAALRKEHEEAKKGKVAQLEEELQQALEAAVQRTQVRS